MVLVAVSRQRYHCDVRRRSRTRKISAIHPTRRLLQSWLSPSRPGRQTDHAEAHWWGCSYVITAVAQGKAAQTNSFLLAGHTEDDKHFQDEPIQIAEPAKVSAQQ